LQKAAPKHWFSPGEKIHVENCPTRFGQIGWTTQSAREIGSGAASRWQIEVRFSKPFQADVVIHIHPPDRRPLRSASLGQLHPDRVVLPASLLTNQTSVRIEVS
jgi:hypothetical protein